MPYEPASFGGRATEGAFRDRSTYAKPTLAREDTSATPRGRAIRWAGAAGAIALFALGLGQVDWETVYRGEGYVPWRTSQKHAVGDCRRFGKHLVLYTYDPRAPRNDRFTESVLASPRVQRLSSGLIWYRRSMTDEEVLAASDGDGPAPPQVQVVAWNLEDVLEEPEDASTITVARFVEMLEAALEVDADPNEVR